MDTHKRGSTSEMQVTSIRLEPELKERLRDLSGEQGYQTLIREVLWQPVEQQMVSDEVRSYAAEDGDLSSVLYGVYVRDSSDVWVDCPARRAMCA